MTATEGVVVVGGGIVGSACAWALAEDGWSVTLVEADGIGEATTTAGMGHLVTLGMSAPLLELTRYSIAQWRTLGPTLPPALEFNPCGTIWIARDESQLKALEGMRSRLGATGLEVEVLDAVRLYGLEPHLATGSIGGIWVRPDVVINAPEAARYFARRTRELGGRVLEHAPAVEVTGQKVVLQDGSVIEGEKVVNAAGPWAGGLTPGVPVHWRKGQLLRLRPPRHFPRHHLTEAGYGDLAVQQQPFSMIFTAQPLPDGTFLLGASRQNGVVDPSPEPKVLEALVGRAEPFLPGVRSLPIVETRAGFRPATPDDLPLIGSWPPIPGLYLATGHEGFGVTASVGTAFLLRDLLRGRVPRIPATPYDPARFVGRSEHNT